VIARNKAHLEGVLPSAAKKNCFHCEKQLQKTGEIFMWLGTESIVMHIKCFADWMRRAQRDLNKHFGVNG
jgi:hypothetical protein